MTRIFTDPVDLDQDELRKLLSAGGAKLDGTLHWAHIRYTGAAWEVVAASDKAGIATGNLTWDSVTNDVLQIALTAFVNPPIVVCTPVGLTAHLPKVFSTAAGEVEISFHDLAADDVQVTVEDTDMDFMIQLMGA
jgi:polyisoprenoid-binding protein YceI